MCLVVTLSINHSIDYAFNLYLSLLYNCCVLPLFWLNSVGVKTLTILITTSTMNTGGDQLFVILVDHTNYIIIFLFVQCIIISIVI